MSEEQKPVAETPAVEVVNTTPKVELTPEQLKQKAEADKKQLETLEKQKSFFEKIQMGLLANKFIYNDIQRKVNQEFNRAERRRYVREMRKGVISPELVQVYLGKAEFMLNYIKEEIEKFNAPKVDGADFYKEVKAQEAAGTLPEQKKNANQ